MYWECVFRCSVQITSGGRPENVVQRANPASMIVGSRTVSLAKRTEFDSPVSPDRNVPYTTGLCVHHQYKKNEAAPPLTLSWCSCRSTILQQQFNRVGHVEHGSVALPGIIRSGSVGGPENFNLGSMPSAQQQITTGQMHRGHMPPLVRGPYRWPGA